jgi:DNA-directed RNA polymerase subunit alpha
MALRSSANWTTLLRPRKPDGAPDTDRRAEFVCEPLECGFGDELGAALRRMLLEAVPGAAVVGARARLGDVAPPASWMRELCLNLSQLVLGTAEMTSYLRLEVPAGRVVRAATVADAGLSVVDAAQGLCIASEHLALELWIERSCGMRLGAKAAHGALPADAWTVDAFFGPVRRADYHTERPQLRPWSHLDRLLLDVETNGAVTPHEALWAAVRALSSEDLAA